MTDKNELIHRLVSTLNALDKTIQHAINKHEALRARGETNPLLVYTIAWLQLELLRVREEILSIQATKGE